MPERAVDEPTVLARVRLSAVESEVFGDGTLVAKLTATLATVPARGDAAAGTSSTRCPRDLGPLLEAAAIR